MTSSVPESLWARLRAEPLRAPEHIALAAADRHAPAAAAWAAEKRSRLSVSHRELGRMAKRRHAALARFEGAATGVGGIFTAGPDLVLLAWIQSRLVFFVAAAYGFDPHDSMRPAELLVLNGIYDTPAEARAALDGMGVSMAEAWIGGQLSRDEALAFKLAKSVGKTSTKKFAGRLIPGFAILFNSVANRRDTNALAKRAIKFYGG